jgi:hypothetical protein
MKLAEVIDQLTTLPSETFICARRPWVRASDAVLVSFPSDLRIPAEVKANGFEYFLEVSTANEILEPFLKVGPTPSQVFDFVLYYAENDAFPDWANELCDH